MVQRKEFPGLELREKMTPKKYQVCLDNLMGYMKQEYNTLESVREYALRQLNSAISQSKKKIGDLAEACFLGDYCKDGEVPKEYLSGVLEGKKDLCYPVLDRIACELNLSSENLFPFNRGRGPSAVAEVVVFPVAA